MDSKTVRDSPYKEDMSHDFPLKINNIYWNAVGAS